MFTRVGSVLGSYLVVRSIWKSEIRFIVQHPETISILAYGLFLKQLSPDQTKRLWYLSRDVWAGRWLTAERRAGD